MVRQDQKCDVAWLIRNHTDQPVFHSRRCFSFYFKFLAYSSSQLKNISTWMFSPRNNVGEIFRLYKETLTVMVDIVKLIHDVEIASSGTRYICVFKMELERFLLSSLAELVARKCNIKGIFLSTFQIRCGGYKGIVSQYPNSSKKLSLRSRMKKFYSVHTKLDALAWTKDQPCFLNRNDINIVHFGG
ncbi:hypothetical protein YC2023_012737 [Brassica napus]